MLGGIPSTTKALLFQAESLPPGSTWKLVGISQDQWPLLVATLTLGGNVRVGLEDNFYLPDGEMARGSSYLVEKAVEMCGNARRGVATIAEAREFLDLPVPSSVPSDYVARGRGEPGPGPEPAQPLIKLGRASAPAVGGESWLM